ncbi:MAG: hypothetical protein N2748_06305, partial [candidate division WOR-3 bacterium]|nr:hypothetical protein [candidate division WOR-3 bacterium]
MRTYIFFICIFQTLIFAARLNESFTGTTFPPIGWRVINNDGGSYTWERYLTNPRTCLLYTS